ncbi:M23 family metallopeptidase [Chitinimonas naiadis]
MQKFRLGLCTTLLAGFTLSLPVLAAPAQPTQSDDTLRKAATAALASRASAMSPDSPAVADSVMDIHQRSGDWVLGSVTQVLRSKQHQVPLSRLFLAHRTDKNWSVGIEGSEAFFTLLATAPDSMLAPSERSAFLLQRSKQQAIFSQPSNAAPLAAGDTGLSLPWAEGVAWYMGGGPHGNSGNSRPFDSIDFSGGNGQVLAPRDGRIYKSCINNGSAIVQLVHDNGYTSRYYHMINLANLADGTLVTKGTYLGQIGNGLPCGGSTTGPHVHFSLSMNGNAVAVNGKTVGGWQFFEGASAYQGYALHEGRQVNPGGRLINYGSGGTTPQPGKTATVTTPNANMTVNIRSAPNLQASIVTTVSNGAQVRLVCYANGDAVNGTWGSTTLWNRLDTGNWISDGFVDTGSNQPVVPACTSAT